MVEKMLVGGWMFLMLGLVTSTRVVAAIEQAGAQPYKGTFMELFVTYACRHIGQGPIGTAMYQQPVVSTQLLNQR
jgi:hypothetical protein